MVGLAVVAMVVFVESGGRFHQLCCVLGSWLYAACGVEGDDGAAAGDEDGEAEPVRRGLRGGMVVIVVVASRVAAAEEALARGLLNELLLAEEQTGGRLGALAEA